MLRDFPTRLSIMVPTAIALKKLGGIADVATLNAAVADLVGISTDLMELKHPGITQSEFAYRCAWARTYLKRRGLLTSPRPRYWTLSSGADFYPIPSSTP